MAERIKVNTGAKTYELVDNDDSVIGSFRFNPLDFDIIDRAEKVDEVFKNLQVKEKGEAAMKQLTTVIKEQFDYLLNYPASDSIFAKCSPVTIIDDDGTLYYETVLESITALLVEVATRREEAMKKRIELATASYKKKE